ncbi:MAG: DUF2520 domain-containing protein [FCB group bacterium]|nr:DUF2520 domain-containing protein [FCB group bacterium]
MGQVPENNERRSYLIVGNGRLARHFQYYFDSLDIPYYHWWRGSSQPFRDLLDQAEKILVLINDGAIEDFVRTHHQGNTVNKIWIHCSGMLSTPLAESAHPLTSFPKELFEPHIYSQIPFITEEGRLPFHVLFPELPNPHYTIPASIKPFYHAWCVMSGNFTTLLWQQFFTVLRERMKLPPAISYLYLDQIAGSLKHSKSPLTGPLARKDQTTIEKHLHVLRDDPFYEVYRAFLQAYDEMEQPKARTA